MKTHDIICMGAKIKMKIEFENNILRKNYAE